MFVRALLVITFLSLVLGMGPKKGKGPKTGKGAKKGKRGKGGCNEAGFEDWRGYGVRSPCQTADELMCDNYAGDVIFAWNRIALDASIRDHNGRARPGNELSPTMGPPASTIPLAKVHAAMFDAYNSITKEYEPIFYMVKEAYYTTGASIDAAVTEAAYQTLIMEFPSQMDIFDQHRQFWLNSVTNTTGRDRGVQVGIIVASMVILSRVGDGTTDPMRNSYDFVDGPGNHQPDPEHPNQNVISPQFGNVKPFLTEPLILASPHPPLSSVEYTIAYNQVKDMGGDNITTPTQRSLVETFIGWYWSYNGSPQLGTPPRHCNEIARVVACKMKNTLSENARFFALVNLGLADAGISTWYTKYNYNLWRPIVGIRDGDDDGNNETVGNANWNYMGASRSNPVVEEESNFSPPFPAYTSGHATFCAVVFKTIANFYGTNDMQVPFKSQEWDGYTLDDKSMKRPCLVQTFSSLSQMTAQCAASRVFNGVHWAFDGTEGAKVGNNIADEIFSNKLRPYNPVYMDYETLQPIESTDETAEIQAILERTAPSPDIETCDGNPDVDGVLWSYLSRYLSQ